MLTVISGVEGIKLAGELWCSELELPRPVTLCLDAPWGYALNALQRVNEPVLVVTGNLSSHYLRDLLDEGPAGLVATTLDQSEMQKAVLRVAKGESFYSGPPLQDGLLADRERQTLRLLAFGLDNAEIADRLGISKQSVANVISSLRDKLGVRNRVEMALQYLGVLQPLLTHTSQKVLERT